MCVSARVCAWQSPAPTHCWPRPPPVPPSPIPLHLVWDRAPPCSHDTTAFLRPHNWRQSQGPTHRWPRPPPAPPSPSLFTC
eukprot:9482707-Pyramimonas_sp.AAC.1